MNKLTTLVFKPNTQKNGVSDQAVIIHSVMADYYNEISTITFTFDPNPPDLEIRQKQLPPLPDYKISDIIFAKGKVSPFPDLKERELTVLPNMEPDGLVHHVMDRISDYAIRKLVQSDILNISTLM
jgi:hypothetical protein